MHRCCAQAFGEEIDDDEDIAKDVAVSGPMVLERYRVLAEYKRQNKTEINLKKGDRVRRTCSCQIAY